MVGAVDQRGQVEPVVVDEQDHEVGGRHLLRGCLHQRGAGRRLGGVDVGVGGADVGPELDEAGADRWLGLSRASPVLRL